MTVLCLAIQHATSVCSELYLVSSGLCLSEEIFAVGTNRFAFIEAAEGVEVRWTMNLVIEFLGIGQLQFILHVWIVKNACTKPQL